MVRGNYISATRESAAFTCSMDYFAFRPVPQLWALLVLQNNKSQNKNKKHTEEEEEEEDTHKEHRLVRSSETLHHST